MTRSKYSRNLWRWFSCVCVCVWVSEWEREKGVERGREREGGRERGGEREREREAHIWINDTSYVKMFWSSCSWTCLTKKERMLTNPPTNHKALRWAWSKAGHVFYIVCNYLLPFELTDASWKSRRWENYGALQVPISSGLSCPYFFLKHKQTNPPLIIIIAIFIVTIQLQRLRSNTPTFRSL